MQTAKKLQRSRVAGKNELYSIVHCDFHLPGTTSLTPRARRYLFFIICLVRSGYERISAPMAVISDAVYRAQGQTASVRTLRSAFAELESAGFLTREKCRLGGDRKNSVIDFNMERFVFWTKIRSGNVIPCNTNTHDSSCRQVLPTDDRLIPNYHVNYQYSSVNTYKEANDHARSKKSAKKHKYHPIVYTLLCVMCAGKRKRDAISLAMSELSGSENISGVDWTYYERLWPALDVSPGGRRETTALREIVPLLLKANGKVVDMPRKTEMEAKKVDMEEIRPPTAEQIASILSCLTSKMSPEQKQRIDELDLEYKSPPTRIYKNLLDDDEMRVLSAAKKACEYKK